MGTNARLQAIKRFFKLAVPNAVKKSGTKNKTKTRMVLFEATLLKRKQKRIKTLSELREENAVEALDRPLLDHMYGSHNDIQSFSKEVTDPMKRMVLTRKHKEALTALAKGDRCNDEVVMADLQLAGYTSQTGELTAEGREQAARARRDTR